MLKERFAGLLFLAFLVLPWPGRAQAELVPDATAEQVRQEAAAGGYRLIEVDELRERYSSGDDLLLVDTRQDWEYQGGHIEGAVHFSMEPTWLARLTKRTALKSVLGPDKSVPIVFY